MSLGYGDSQMAILKMGIDWFYVTYMPKNDFFAYLFFSFVNTTQYFPMFCFQQLRPPCGVLMKFKTVGLVH